MTHDYSPMTLARAFVQSGELADALEALNAQLDAVPDDADARRLRAEVLARRSDAVSWLAAIADLEAVAGHTASDWLRLSGLYDRLDDLPAALRAVEVGLVADPADVRLIEREVTLLIRLGQHTAALARASAMPETWSWLKLCGSAAVAAGDFQAALTFFTRALAAFPAVDSERGAALLDAARAHLIVLRASAALAAGDLDLADRDYQTAALLLPRDPLLAFNRGMIAAARGDLEAARTLCRTAYAAASAHVRAVMHDEAARSGYLPVLTLEE
jgi:tetratricopeptide (TPR) repeat protein